LEGFELDAVDYLVKPIPFDRFLKATLKARQFLEARQKASVTTAADDYFFIKSENRLVKISYREILFVEALQNYVIIHTDQKKYITYLTFRSVEEYLSGHDFLKTHKSYIVAGSRVDSIDGNEIRIKDHRIPVSRSLKEEVMEKLLKGKFLKR
jgi:DNA-binding LytR/AlgR family response regulator